MAPGISDRLLVDFREFVSEKMGLYFSEERLNDMARGLGSAAAELGFDDEESCAKWLMSSRLTREQTEILAAHLTVGETYFFREKKSFEAFEWEILPQLIDSRRKSGRHLRIWSAGCATGEEAYSIAILLSKIIPDLKKWNILILATDINPHFLCRASKGVYGAWSFRDSPSWLKPRYFRKTEEGRFEIHPDISGMVTFEYQNLAQDAYPSLLSNTNAMDVIFCRNVLMYFSPGMQKRVIQNFYRSLVEGGWLMVSPSEMSNDLFPQFACINFSGTTFYKKDTAKCLIDEASSLGGRQQRTMFQDTTAPSPLSQEYTGEMGIDLSATAVESIETAGDKKPSAKLTPDPYEKARDFYGQGCYDEALRLIEILLSENSLDPKLMALLAMVYANQGRLSDALEWSEKAVALDKMNPDRHYLLATILQEQGKTGEAAAALKKSLYLNQDFVLAHFMLGNMMRRQDRMVEADKHFNNALLLLERRNREEIVGASEGLTAGRLIEIINSTCGRN